VLKDAEKGSHHGANTFHQADGLTERVEVYERTANIDFLVGNAFQAVRSQRRGAGGKRFIDGAGELADQSIPTTPAAWALSALSAINSLKPASARRLCPTPRWKFLTCSTTTPAWR